MIMHRIRIDMSADDKGMVAVRPAFRKRISYAVRFGRVNLTRFERLSDVVGKHIMFSLTAVGGTEVLLFGNVKLSIGGSGGTLVGGDEFVVVGLIRVFNVVRAVRYGLGNALSTVDMKRFYPCSGQWQRLPS